MCEKVCEKVCASYKTIKTIKTKKNIYNKLYILKKDFFTSAFMCLDINKNKLKIKDLVKILKSNNKNIECNNKTDNTLITITNKTEDTTKKKEKGKSKQKKDITKQLYKLIDEYTENEELKEILRQRVQHKKELNKHFTITSFKLFIKELDKIKDDDKKIEAINISISKNWQGFKSTWIDNLNNNTFTNTKIKEKISNINNIQTFKKTKEYEEKVMQEGIERGKEYIRKLEEKSEYIGDISKVANFDFDDKGQMIGFDKNKNPVYWEIFKNIET